MAVPTYFNSLGNNYLEYPPGTLIYLSYGTKNKITSQINLNEITDGNSLFKNNKAITTFAEGTTFENLTNRARDILSFNYRNSTRNSKLLKFKLCTFYVSGI